MFSPREILTNHLPPIIWWLAISAIVFVIVGVLIVDFDFFLIFGAPGTITDWLRVNKWAAIVPLAVIQAFIVWLVGHLFLHWWP
jgi:hypothetical protein